MRLMALGAGAICLALLLGCSGTAAPSGTASTNAAATSVTSSASASDGSLQGSLASAERSFSKSMVDRDFEAFSSHIADLIRLRPVAHLRASSKSRSSKHSAATAGFSGLTIHSSRRRFAASW